MLLACLGSCGGDPVRIDVCPRGRVDALFQTIAAGHISVVLRDANGVELKRFEVGSNGATIDATDIGDAARIDVEGLDPDGAVRAFGTAVIEGDSCICFARLEDHRVACEAVACTFSDGACNFEDPNGDELPACAWVPSSPSAYAERLLADLPLAYYQVDELSGPVAQDATEVGLDGTYAGAVMLGVAGVLSDGTAMEVTEANAYLRLPEALTPWTADFSVESWFQLLQAPVFRGAIFIMESAGRGFRFGLAQDRTLRFWCSESGCASEDIVGRRPLRLAEWHHVALIRQGDEVRMFLDGEQDAIGTSVFVAPLSSDNGGFGSTQGTPIAARFDEVAVHGSAIPAAALRAHHEVGSTGMRLDCGP